MAKGQPLSSIQAERAKLEEQLAAVIQREKAAQDAERDAGRTVLIGQLSKVKIAAMGRTDAKAIADAIAKHGGAKVSAALSAING